MRHSDFLLFVPVDNPGLRAILSYYASSVKVNAEGDVHVSDETKQGAGTAPHSRFSLTRLFGLHPQPRIRHRPPDVPDAAATPSPSEPSVPVEKPFVEVHEGVVVEESVQVTQAVEWKTRLTAWVPVSLGYFIAGATAGIVSRTTTAPLDRFVLPRDERPHQPSPYANTTKSQSLPHCTNQPYEQGNGCRQVRRCCTSFEACSTPT